MIFFGRGGGGVGGPVAPLRWDGIQMPRESVIRARRGRCGIRGRAAPEEFRYFTENNVEAQRIATQRWVMVECGGVQPCVSK